MVVRTIVIFILTEVILEIKSIVFNHDLWQPVAEYANSCSWQPTGAYLANRMENNEFLDWERVFDALENSAVIGFCALTKTTVAFGGAYTPDIGFVFVGESYRGNRVSEKLCMSAVKYAKSIGFDKIYLYSDHVNLYEKYGFTKIDEQDAPWGTKQSIFMYTIL